MEIFGKFGAVDGNKVENPGPLPYRASITHLVPVHEVQHN